VEKTDANLDRGGEIILQLFDGVDQVNPPFQAPHRSFDAGKLHLEPEFVKNGR